MDYSNIMTRTETKYVTKRYKVKPYHDEQLSGIEERTGVSPSMVVRLALDILLPRLKNENVSDLDKRLKEIFIN